jgi:hypothetical protein
MDDKMANILQMKTWFFVSLLLDRQAITCKWIYKKVPRINGEAGQYKAMLVTRGCEQRTKVYFGETFALVANWSTIKTMNVLV